MTETEARQLGKELQAQLGPGWTPRVWENLDWNVAMHRGPITLHVSRAYTPSNKIRYSCLIDDEVAPKHLGVGSLFFGEAAAIHGTDPVKVVRQATRACRRKLEKLYQFFVELEKEQAKG